MRNKTFTIVDESGVEFLVNADYEIYSEHDEECHGIKTFPASVTIDIKCAELIIANTGIVITDSLNKKQISAIEDQIINQLAIAA